jgi:hypothetical protein
MPHATHHTSLLKQAVLQRQQSNVAAKREQKEAAEVCDLHSKLYNKYFFITPTNAQAALARAKAANGGLNQVLPPPPLPTHAFVVAILASRTRRYS